MEFWENLQPAEKKKVAIDDEEEEEEGSNAARRNSRGEWEAPKKDTHGNKFGSVDYWVKIHEKNEARCKLNDIVVINKKELPASGTGCLDKKDIGVVLVDDKSLTPYEVVNALTGAKSWYEESWVVFASDDEVARAINEQKVDFAFLKSNSQNAIADYFDERDRRRAEEEKAKRKRDEEEKNGGNGGDSDDDEDSRAAAMDFYNMANHFDNGGGKEEEKNNGGESKKGNDDDGYVYEPLVAPAEKGSKAKVNDAEEEARQRAVDESLKLYRKEQAEKKAKKKKDMFSR
jgi:hypothetical protein